MPGALKVAVATLVALAAGELVVGEGAQVAKLEAPIIIETDPLPDDAEGQGVPKIVGGEVADQKQYPAIFRARFAGSSCTWFLVGPKVLLSAAHCLGGATGSQIAARVRIKLPGAEAVFETQECATAAAYPADRSQDWAACRFATAVPAPVGANVVGYEVLSRTPVRKNASVRIGGYGCVESNGTMSKVYVIGNATVSDAPPRALLPGAFVETPNAIELMALPAFLCGGDSGGPAFFYEDESDSITRRVIGLNMHTVMESKTSFLASLNTGVALEFLQSWSTKHGLQICGLDPSTPSCRP
jgi:hypothetical protein